jgi:hypothetical protein
MSSAGEMLRWLEQTHLSAVIRRSGWAVMALEAAHLLGLALLGGAAVIVGLAALYRGGLRGIGVARFVTELRWLALGGLLLLVASGSLIALSMPFKYYNNVAFQAKMMLLACALSVTLLLSGATRQPGAGDRQEPAVQRVLALLALLLWTGVGLSGRLIGFL